MHSKSSQNTHFWEEEEPFCVQGIVLLSVAVSLSFLTILDHSLLFVQTLSVTIFCCETSKNSNQGGERCFGLVFGRRGCSRTFHNIFLLIRAVMILFLLVNHIKKVQDRLQLQFYFQSLCRYYRNYKQYPLLLFC